MTNDAIDTNSKSNENETSDEGPSSILCDVSLFIGNLCDDDSTDWIMDSGATKHMTASEEVMERWSRKTLIGSEVWL